MDDEKDGLIILLLALVFTLTACGTFTCDFCGKEKSGKKHTSDLYGTKLTVWDDCYKGLGSLLGM